MGRKLGTNKKFGGTVSASVDEVGIKGQVSSNNSSTSALGSGATFTGTSDDVTNFRAIGVSVLADQDSAVGGLSIEFSSDGTNWDDKTTHDVSANVHQFIPTVVRAKFFRIVYTNGGTGQGSFRIQSFLHSTNIVGGGSDLATETTLDLVKLNTDNLDTALSVLESSLDGIESNTTDISAIKTVLDSIKLDTAQLDTNLSTLSTSLSNIDSNTNDVATQTTLALIKTSTDNLDIALSVLESSLDSIVTNTNDVATQTTLSSILTINTDIRTSVQLLDNAVSGSELQVDVVAPLPAGENHIGSIGGESATVTASFTRPADTNIYAVNDAVSDSTSSATVITFAAIARLNDEKGLIMNAFMTSSANQATKGDFKLLLFNASPTAQNDNAAMALSDAEANTIIGIIEFKSSKVHETNTAAGASGNVTYVGTIEHPITLDPGSGTDDIYGILVADSAYTPVASEVFTIRLGVEQN